MDIRRQGLNNSNIVPRLPRTTASAAARPPAAPLPAYMLYGEAQPAGLPDLLHLETIAQRSRLHDWEIRPHRHPALFQILVIARGVLQAMLDDATQPLQGPCAIAVPAMVVHGFQFDPGIDGMVVTVAARQVQALTGGDAAWCAALAAPRVLAPAPTALLQAAEALRDEHARGDSWRALALDAALRRLLLELARALPAAMATATPAPARALQHAQRFQALVDAHFRAQPPLAALAAPLGITTTQLERVCRAVLGRSALGVLHDRLLLEAQRELGYTRMSVKQVAIGLGFADAGYFARWFQQRTGLTPTAWRTASALGVGAET
jgi:AraC family transcriptional activator of pobA